MSILLLQEPDKAREIFFLYDREATGKLTVDNFYKALLAGGAKVSETEFKSMLTEFGNAPTLVVFKQALQKAKSREETFESLKAKFAPFGDSLTIEALKYFVTFSTTDEETDEFLKLVDPDATGLVTVDSICHKLIPH
jgi:Ca2+-binding EF-hand superfamily protein